ncbi:hypothetical protein GCM10028802_30790 [Terrabacter terrigena]
MEDELERDPRRDCAQCSGLAVSNPHLVDGGRGQRWCLPEMLGPPRAVMCRVRLVLVIGANSDGRSREADRVHGAYRVPTSLRAR